MNFVALTAMAASLGAASAQAQVPATTGDAPAPVPSTAPAADTAAPTAAGQVFTPADFARFAPRTAYDMLVQVPGFQIRESETLRGLGQATGNVLFNGQRPSAKSQDLQTQLTRIPAGSVIRIEIVDGASLDLPGLSGQVANIVYKAASLTGQFSWRPEFRAHYTDPLFTRADVSASGTKGPVQYEVSLDNSDSARSGAGGPTLIFDAAGIVTERRRDVWNTHYDSPRLTGRFTIDAPGDSVAHLNVQYQRIYDRYDETGLRVSPGSADRERIVRERNDSWNYELGGDYDFGLGPGRLKMIGLRRYSREPYSQEVVVTPADGSSATGDRFAQLGRIAETIGRGEYGWKMLGGDWQLSGEGAFNSLDNVAVTGELSPDGTFINEPLVSGSGRVSESRYEALLSFGRPVSRTVSLQVVAGAERSTITQNGAGGLTRTFVRPKGSLSVSWKPTATFDASIKLRRRVLQLSFYDFLARAFLNDDNANAGNADLRPQQDWTVEFEANRQFGAWGSSKLRVIYRDIQDFVDIVPVPGGESVGNVPKSSAAGIDWTSTLQFEPIGWRGARLTSRVLWQRSRVRDPFTGEFRSRSGFTERLIELGLRHDVPRTDWAYGSNLEYVRQAPNYRSTNIDWLYEGPVFAGVFVENKDVFGLTVRFTVDNILNARSRRERTFYTGLRNATPVASSEYRDRLIGPMFKFSVRGTF